MVTTIKKVGKKVTKNFKLAGGIAALGVMSFLPIKGEGQNIETKQGTAQGYMRTYYNDGEGDSTNYSNYKKIEISLVKQNQNIADSLISQALGTFPDNNNGVVEVIIKSDLDTLKLTSNTLVGLEYILINAQTGKYFPKHEIGYGYGTLKGVRFVKRYNTEGFKFPKIIEIYPLVSEDKEWADEASLELFGDRIKNEIQEIENKFKKAGLKTEIKIMKDFLPEQVLSSNNKTYIPLELYGEKGGR